MDLSGWLAIAALCTSGAVSPGPSLAVVVKNTVEGGSRQGSLAAIGHALGIGLYAFGAVVGVGALVQRVPVAASAVSLLGAAYLVKMGYGVWTHAGEVAEDHEQRGASGFVEGFLIAFLNPKTAVFFLALFATMVPAQASWGTRGGVAALACGIDMVWFVLVAQWLSRTRLLPWLRTHQLQTDRAMALILFTVAGVLCVRLLLEMTG